MHPLRTLTCANERRALGLSLVIVLLTLPLHMPDEAMHLLIPERSGPSRAAQSAGLPLFPIGGPFQLDQAPFGELSAAPNAAVPDDWYNTVMANIASSEYHINYQEQAGAYQSPNRKQDLRITYRADGFELKPRVDEDAWKVELTLDRIGKPGSWMLPSGSATITTHEASLVAEHGGFTMDYHNSAEGMRQNFVVRDKPQGDGPLEVRLNYTGTLHAADKGGNAIAFCSPVSNGGSYTPTVWYKDLHVWDANGDTLEATASLDGSELVLSVNDSDAEYPITVDPLSNTAAWTAESDQINARFGACVSSAGDVNRDGYSDVIIGAPYFDGGQTDEGRVYVFRGSATGLLATPYWTEESDQASALFGTSVSTAGDVNGDGWSDVIIGAPNFDNGQTNEGRAFVYEGGFLGLPAAADWTSDSNQADAQMGYSVSLAGDVNADGFSDVIVGIRLSDYIFTNDGRASVFHGGATGLSPVMNWSTVGNQDGAQLGTSVAGAGDVNGDGFSDVIVGAPLWNGTQVDEGKISVFHGSVAGLAATASTEFMPNAAGVRYGASVSTAGDFNGDGYSDIAIGAPNWGSGLTSQSGMAFIRVGSAAGIVGAGTFLMGTQANELLGSAVACAGDVNGDGFGDVLIASPDWDGGLVDEGRVQLLFGSSNPSGSTVGWATEGDQLSAAFGTSVASAGDVNGDGYSDVIVGAQFFDNGQTNEGRAFVYHGSPAGLTAAAAWSVESDQANAEFSQGVSGAGDVNGDGFSDVIVGAPYFDNGQPDGGRAFVYHGSLTGLGTTPNWSTGSDQASAYMGSSVFSAGDVNGDGFGDVIVGAASFDNGQTNEGRAFVFHGSSTGLSATANWTAESDQSGALFGTVSSAGDVNGDGFSDVIIGAARFDDGETDEGKVYLYHGGTSGLAATPNWTAESNQTGACLGSSVASAGDVNGDGFSDVVIGAVYYDAGNANEGRAFVYHGSPNGLNTVAWIAESNQTDAYFGWSVASAGDVNGDGFADLVVVAPRAIISLSHGRAYLFNGSSSGLSLTPDWTYIQANNWSSTYIGQQAASAGDVNGDGYSDLIVGNSRYSNGLSNEGCAQVFLGGPTGPSIAPDWTVEGEQADSWFGSACTGVGDVNGDGYSDVIVGSMGFDNPETNEGRAFVYHGNNGTGRRHNLRLYNTDLTAPISQSNIANNQFGAGLYAKPFLGRGRARLV